MSLLNSSEGRSFGIKEIGLLDRTPVDPIEIARSGRARRARKTILAVVCIAVVLGLSALSIPLLMKPGEAPRKALVNYTIHAPIVIMGDAQFTAANGVTDGTGTPSDPFIIDGWEIDATSGMFGVGVMVYMTTAHYVIRGVHVFGADAICMELFTAPNGTIENCTVESAMMGLAVMDCSDINITGNTVLSMDLAGIAIIASSRVDTSRNTVTGSNSMGIMVSESDNITVIDSVSSTSNGFGMGFQVADNILIRGNNASSNAFCGIFLNDTRKATVEGNNLTMNLRYGAYIGNASDVNVYHNRFIGNVEQAFQGPNTTSLEWDDGYPSGGNYWSDYTGVDGNGDGIGDTSYAVSGGGTDRFPFMTEGMGLIPEFGMMALPALGLIALIVICRRKRKPEPD